MKIKRLIKHNLMRATMTLALILACATAWAQTKQSVTYIDENGQTQTVDATLLTASTSSTSMSGWYVASGTFTNNNRLAVNYDYATLNLILADDCHLTMIKGLQVPSHATLNIYSQSKGSSMGKLTITTPATKYAGIGGSNNMTQSIPSGNINIYGGDLNITGGSSGAGIGGGHQAAAQGAILITNGAKVVATGGSGGAGIGGGYQASFSSITITGNATVTASATNGGEAIGRGQGASQSGTLSITNSTVNNVHYDADGFQDGSTHTVTFNSQGGTAVAAQTVGLKYGQTIVKANEPTVPTRTYYVFGGWYKESNCTNAWDFDNDAVTEDITLYAKWTPDPDHFSVSDDGNTYTIHTATGWGLFCDALQDNETYNRFSGKTVELGTDIGTAQDPITRMAGSSHCDFCGTFDGQGHTLTVNIHSDNEHEYTAPFSYISETTPTGGSEVSHPAIRNLNVAGTVNATKDYASGIVGAFWGTLTIENCTSSVTINTNNKHAAGFIGYAAGNATITNCLSSVTINSSVSGDGTHAGFIGGSHSGTTFTIEGCAFTGKLLTSNGTNRCAGFVGYNSGTLTISNSLFAPTEVTIGTTSSATFARNGATITNCYYTTDFNDGEHFTAQGKQRHSITADENVTVAFSGTANEYQTSGITAYKDGNTQLPGLKYGDVLYAGNGDEVSLTLNNSIGGDVPEGYQYAYSTNAGTLDGSTLTMPDANVIVSVSTALRSTGQPVSITYGGHNQTHNAIALDGTESSLGESGQETWYFVGTDISHSGTIECSGKVNIILADGKTMTITSSDGHGIDVYNFLTVYGQELGTGTLNAIINNSIGIYSHTGNITIRGGQVTATTSGSFGGGIYTQYGSVTIYGGQVTATGNTTPGNSGICAFTGSVTIYGGQVTATGSSGIYTYSGSVTINGGQVTANGSTYGIYAEGGNVTINGGQVTATGDVGIFTQSGGSVTINGGQVSAIGNNYGICAENSNNITLGWTTASDYIYANTYYADYDYAEGTLSIAEGKTFIDEAGNTYSSTIAQVDDAYAIDGKWLYPNTVSRFTKTIAAHQTEEGVNYGWYLIASPLSGETNAEAVAHLVNSETPANFDLYRFNQAADLEWENWKQQNSDHYHFNLEPGIGYLYANAADVNLVFAGTPYRGNGEVTLQKTEGAELSGWNLVGNPFTVEATLSQPYYRMNEQGSALKTETESTSVATMEGVFVKADEDGQSVTFTAQRRGGEKRAVAALNVKVGPSTGSGTSILDNAIIRFDGGQTLEKFSFREGSTKIYIPQDGTDYAIACAESTGEMPLNFRAKENGEYTITVNPENVEMAYLHLIDNMTGNDVNLLETPYYSFDATTTDYESRFRLVFATGSSVDGGNFGFVNASGNFCIFGIEGEATVQVVDILGHMLSSETFSGSYEKKLNVAPGVYMLRLIQGKDVKVQKTVIK